MLPGRQELWSLLASASTTDSGIPQSILDKLADELQQKKDIQDAINVRLLTSCRAAHLQASAHLNTSSQLSDATPS